MIISMASFAVGDTFVKISGAFLSPAQIMFFLIAGGLINFCIDRKNSKGVKIFWTAEPFRQSC